MIILGRRFPSSAITSSMLSAVKVNRFSPLVSRSIQILLDLVTKNLVTLPAAVHVVEHNGRVVIFPQTTSRFTPVDDRRRIGEADLGRNRAIDARRA